jgi:Methylase involved in ubiquinone/menaquinone biosynthesis
MLKKLKELIVKEQFEPSLLGIVLNPFYIARKGLLESIKAISAEITGNTLDVGCGTKPYEKYFKSSKYTGLEIDTTINRDIKKADIFYDGNTFPFGNKEFDSVVSNQVFEHVFNPLNFLKEINRVLKINGKILLTVPFVWDEHEQPYDFARYSSFGLKSVLQNNGFEVISNKKSINDFRVLVQLLNGYLYKKSVHNFFLKQFLTLFVMFPINLIGILIAKLLPKNDDLYLDNIILARKVKDV